MSSMEPISIKRKNDRSSMDVEEDDDDDLGFDLNQFNVKTKDESKKIWVHFENPTNLTLEEKREQRDNFLEIFSTFGVITDFYIPISLETDVSFCYVEYKESRNASSAVKIFSSEMSLLDKENVILPVVSKAVKETVPTHLARITQVDLASNRGLLYSSRTKRRKRFDNQMEESSSPSSSSPGFKFGGMTTVNEVSKMESWGEDISDFVIPKGEDTNEVPLPDSSITIGYFKQM